MPSKPSTLVSNIRYIPEPIQHLQRIVMTGEWDYFDEKRGIACIHITPFDVMQQPGLTGVEKVYFAYEHR